MNKHEDRHIDIIFGNYAEVSGDSVRDFNFHYKSGSSGEDFSGNGRYSFIHHQHT